MHSRWFGRVLPPREVYGHQLTDIDRIVFSQCCMRVSIVQPCYNALITSLTQAGAHIRLTPTRACAMKMPYHTRDREWRELSRALYNRLVRVVCARARSRRCLDHQCSASAHRTYRSSLTRQPVAYSCSWGLSRMRQTWLSGAETRGTDPHQKLA